MHRIGPPNAEAMDGEGRSC